MKSPVAAGVAILCCLVLAGVAWSGEPGPTATPSPTPTESPTTTPSPSPTTTPEEVGPAALDSPNIVVIYTDDQRFDTLHWMPETVAGVGGVSYENAFATTPLCCPSRASFLTGQYAHNHGVWVNGLGLGQTPAESSTLATYLDNAGYETGFVGKYFNRYRVLIRHDDAYIPPGWDHWAATDGAPKYDFTIFKNGEYLDAAPGEFAPDRLTDEAIEFIQGAEAPYFLWLAYNVPHEPNPDPPGISCGATVQCALEALDLNIARLLDEIPADTVVIFTSDNGLRNLARDWPSGKNCPWDECLRVPLIIRHPLATGAGIALNIDLMPTILAIASLPIPGSVDGIDILGESRSDFLFEMEEGGERWQGVRNANWKYILNPDGSEQLYKLRVDPLEAKNLAGRARQADRLAEMRARLSVLQTE